MHVDQAGRHYTTVGGERRAYPTYLLRRSFRDEHGRPRKETLANLTGLPEESIAALRATLRGRTLVDAEAAFEVERSVPHGDVAAAHVVASALGLRALLARHAGTRHRLCADPVAGGAAEAEAVHRALVGGRGHHAGIDLGVADAGTDEIYAAMDWLTSRQREVERQLAARHLRPGGSRCSTCHPPGWRARAASWPRSALPRRQARPQADRIRAAHMPEGRPVAVEVFPGNTADPESFKTAITRVRRDFASSA